MNSEELKKKEIRQRKKILEVAEKSELTAKDVHFKCQHDGYEIEGEDNNQHLISAGVNLVYIILRKFQLGYSYDIWLQAYNNYYYGIRRSQTSLIGRLGIPTGRVTEPSEERMRYIERDVKIFRRWLEKCKKAGINYQDFIWLIEEPRTIKELAKRFKSKEAIIRCMLYNLRLFEKVYELNKD